MSKPDAQEVEKISAQTPKRRYVRQPTKIVTEYDAETGVKRSHNLIGLTEFPTLTQYALKHRDSIRAIKNIVPKPLPSSDALQLNPSNKFHDKFREAKRAIRNSLKKNPLKRTLGHHNGEVFTQVVYLNPLIQAFFDFALKYAQNALLENKKFSISTARRLFVLSSKESLKLRVTKGESKTRKKAKEIFDTIYVERDSVEADVLRTFIRGREPGSLNADMKAFRDEIKPLLEQDESMSNRKLSAKLKPGLDDNAARTAHAAKIGRKRKNLEDANQIPRRKRPKTKKDILKKPK